MTTVPRSYRSEDLKRERIQQFGNPLGEMVYHFEVETLAANEKWFILRGVLTNNERIELINNISIPFFSVLLESLIENLFMFISRATDPDRMGHHETISLSQFLNHLNEPEKSTMRQRVEHIEQYAKPVRTRRNRMYAHLDKDALLKLKPYLLPGVSYSTLEYLVNEITEALKEFARLKGIQDPLREWWVPEETQIAPLKVFGYLQKGWE